MPQVAFAGTPDFAVPCLRSLLAGGCNVPLVLTQPDRPAGRGRSLTRSPVKRAALAHGLDVRQPRRLDSGAVPKDWGAAPDLLVVAAYGLLLPPWLLQWPRLGAVNVHASLLPRWRGAAPIQYAILAGDAETGASIMQMDSGLDTGPVYSRRNVTIEAGETAGMLHDRIARLGAELMVEDITRNPQRRIAARTAERRPGNACAQDRKKGRGSGLDQTGRGAGAPRARLQPLAGERDLYPGRAAPADLGGRRFGGTAG